MNNYYILKTCNTPEGEIVQSSIKDLREVFSATESDITSAYNNQRWDEIRAQRDNLIAETDWWVLSDVGATDEQLSYRQALRDVTSQDDVDNITWPVKP